MAAGILMSREAVDDTLQEAYTRMLRAGRKFDDERQAFNFIKKVVINTAIDNYRKRRRRRRIFILKPNSWIWEAPAETLGMVADENPLQVLLDKEAKALERLLVREVILILSQLPARQRDAIAMLCDHQERSFREVCAEAGIPYSTARSRVYGGLKRIRSVIVEGGEFKKTGPDDESVEPVPTAP